MKEVSSRLQNAGFNSAICKSKWKSSPDIPSGNYYIVHRPNLYDTVYFFLVD